MLYYKKFLPVPALQPYISWFYLLEYDDQVPFTLSSSANPACAMVFNYGDCYRLSNAHYQDSLLPRQFMSGISTEPFKLTLSGKVGSLGVIFRTNTFKDIFDLPDLSGFTDRRLELDLFSGHKLDGFLDMLAEAKTHQEKIYLANQYFLHLLQPVLLQGLSISDRIMTDILALRGFVSMDELARKYSITSRHLRRLFKERTGVSPKFYARVKRFGYTFYSLNAKTFDWRRFMGQHGYYDQAHLIRDFKLFTGSTPRIKAIEKDFLPDPEA